MKLILSLGLIAIANTFKLNHAKASHDDPICGGLGCELNHGQWNTRPEAFELNNTSRNLFVQVNSDPICSSAGCPEQQRRDEQEVKPYVDHYGPAQKDVTTSSLEWAEKHYGKKWDPKFEENAAKQKEQEARYNFNPELDHDI